MMFKLQALPRLCWHLIRGVLTKDYSGVNSWKNHHLSGGDPTGDFVIAFFNDCFGQPLNLHALSVPKGVHFTGNPNRLREADALVFHIPSLKNIPFSKPLGQLWVAWSMESAENHPCLKDSEFLASFDLMMTYQMSADVWCPYLLCYSKDIEKDLRRAALPKQSGKLLSSFVSSGFNLSGRQEYLTELSHYCDLHAYGIFGRTHELERDRGRTSKLETIAQYKFTIAFENSIEEDYVTEKFFDPLLAGSVPVYLGAPNVSQFAPGHQCYIDVNDFTNSKSLAEYLQHLNDDDWAYSRYFEWKLQPFQQSFVDMVEVSWERGTPFERLGRIVRSRNTGSEKIVATR